MSTIEDELQQTGYGSLIEILKRRDSAAELLRVLPAMLPPEKIQVSGKEQRAWELCGQFYLFSQRFHEALNTFEGLYDNLIRWQAATSRRTHQGLPLIWMYESHVALQNPVLAKRYLMLTLIEDAIRDGGNVRPDSSLYFRFVSRFGWTEKELKRYVQVAHQKHQEDPEDSLYPEWVLQRLDSDWMQEYPSLTEAAYYRANLHYVRYLIGKLGDGSGRILERLAQYLLSVIPGCRTYWRKTSGSTDYDVVCSLEGSSVDFRAELGRYFVCECKDWDKPADFATIAKFCRVLDSTKCRFGVLFSKSGLSGAGRTRDGERELLKVFQDRGIVIVVIDQNDLRGLSSGTSLLAMLRSKYERIRLDLFESPART